MKNLKIIAIVLCATLAFVYSCTTDEDTKAPENTIIEANVIGIQVDGEFQLEERESLKAQWEQRLYDQGYAVTLEQFDFVKGDFDGVGKTNTILMASNADGTVKIAAKVTLGEATNSGNSRIAPVIIAGESVTCTGCRVGCNPEDNPTYGWICTSCVVGDECTKTVSTQL